MLLTITITTTEAEAMQQVYERIIEFSHKSPNTAALLDIKPVFQDRINQVLDRIKKTEPHDGRNIYLISSPVPSDNQANPSNSFATTDTDPGTVLANH